MTEFITGDVFKTMIASAAACIENRRQEINDLNVFPVPDGDTGTNMSLTMIAGAEKLAASSAGTVGRNAEIAASALLRSARGNSGVILSLLFRGIAKSLKDVDSANAEKLAEALTSGVDSAYKAVMKPAEGTILTVSRMAAAEAAAAAESEIDIEVLLERTIQAAKEALAKTIDQNPVLKKAGVIDAGGKGFIYILEGMLEALRGNVIEREERHDEQEREKADFSDFNTEDIKFTYCTEFIVDRKTNKEPNALRDFLDKRGDSIVVVDDDEVIKVHVHTNVPGVVLTQALTYGPLITVKVENMRQQHTEKVVSQEDEHRIAPSEKHYGVVAVCAGEGLESIFRDLGADGIITGGQTMNPSTEDILKKVDMTPADVVFVLPNNSNIIMAASQCVPLTEKKVIVIPTKTVAQGISALLSFSADSDDETNTEAMTEAAGAVHTAQVTYAARDSVFDGKSIKAGEYLALLENTLVSNGPVFEKVIAKLAEEFAQFDPSLVTIYSGENAKSIETAIVEATLAESLKDAEVSTVPGGQPVYYYMISAE